MTDQTWEFIDAMGVYTARSWGMPRMTGRVLGWLLACDPPEQTAAEIATALGASRGAISGATGTLVRIGMIDRLHVRGERADRFRLREEAWEEQSFDQGTLDEARAVLAQGLKALDGEPASRRARIQELDAFYAWWQERAPALHEEWRRHRRGGKAR